MNKSSSIEIFKTENSVITIEVSLTNDTVWLNRR